MMENDSATTSPYSVKNKNAVLLGIGGLFVANTVASWLLVPFPTAYGLSSILLSVAVLAGGIVWCHMDAAERGIPLGHGFKLLAILAFVIALPYYLIKSRGLKRALWSFVKIAGFLAVLVVILTIVEFTLAMIDDRNGFFLMN